MSDILEKIRKLNWMLQESPTGTLSFDDLCEILSDLMEANVTIIDYDGTLMNASLKIPEDTDLIWDEDTECYVLPEEFTKELNKIDTTVANLDNQASYELVKYRIKTPNKLHTVIPVVGGGKRWGTLLMTRYEPEFSDEDLALGEYGATIVGLVIAQRRLIKEREEIRSVENVQMAIDTLSYSETEAVQHIFSELEGDNGILVASRIADRSGITRSVIVNALRKLESAGVIETRSLGMKGTRIRILNPKLKSELKKVKE